MVDKEKFTCRGTFALKESQMKWIKEKVASGKYSSIAHVLRVCVNLAMYYSNDVEKQEKV